MSSLVAAISVGSTTNGNNVTYTLMSGSTPTSLTATALTCEIAGNFEDPTGCTDAITP